MTGMDATEPLPPAPGQKPHVIYDGECRFCKYWVDRWQNETGDAVVYLPFQDPAVARNFPSLSKEAFSGAIHFIDAEGRIFRGAAAVFSLRAKYSGAPAGLWAYENLPGAKQISEAIYSLVARHRPLFSRLTLWFWGTDARPSTYSLATWLFLRLLGLIYLAAFLSIWIQADGLWGSSGIAPLKDSLQIAERQLESGGRFRTFLQYPTLFWWGAGDQALNLVCCIGFIAALFLAANILPLLALPILWLLYLTLTITGQEFLRFQWDALLLETGLLTIFLGAPLLSRFGTRFRPSRVVLWLLGWLLFRLMFQSGCVKLLSGDPAWRALTALQFHYETQPLPTWVGYFVHQSPAIVHRISAAGMFAAELILPFLIFTPRRSRMAAGAAFVALQGVILITGNYCFFNWLTIALALLLFDDAALEALARRLRLKLPQISAAGRAPDRQPLSFNQSLLPSTPARGAGAGGVILNRVRRVIIALLFAVVLVVTTIQLADMFHPVRSLPAPVLKVYGAVAPFHSINRYGLFAVMTTNRPELIVEGSQDGRTWLPYEFKYKPGDLKQRPRFVAPHQPRLDWQMWFAALGGYRQNPWLVQFCVRLLEGSPAVLNLLKTNPFPSRPPRYIRVQRWEYHFTDWATLRERGEWWRRDQESSYLPVISLRTDHELGRSRGNETLIK